MEYNQLRAIKEDFMRRHFFYITASLLLLSSATWGQSFSGTVYGVYPEGVMVRQGVSSFLVPTQHATFEIGGVRATWSSLQPGQVVNYVVPSTYYPEVVRISDPYAWKMKHHPSHPHGGPPGQTKKNYGPKGKKGKGR